MLGLHQVDGAGLVHTSVLPPPQSWPEAEERRRTWWALYCSDRLVGGTAGWPVLIDEKDMSVRLPASERAFESGIEEMTSLFTSGLHEECQIFSPFAGRVIATSLFHQAFQHSIQAPLHNSALDPGTSIHWKHYREIDNNLVVFLQALPNSLRLPREIRCRNAVFVNIIIHMSFICLHRAAISRMKSFGLPKSMIRRSTARLVCAAEEILNIFRMMSDMNEHLKNSILVYSVYLTSQVFLEDLEPTEDFSQQDSLDFVLRIMVLSAKLLDNAVSGSMAVQLAMEMRQRGLDSHAVEKALELPLSRHLIPTFTKGDAPSSGPVFRLPSNNET
ncbi:binuclear zinc transcription factor [Colletotrichum tofieldiae]|uniref:Binuclear zinc transcription factor n=1 Tax=Colletotrichum tofieldiae TaxID=708197 RepID=A0A166N4M7_9PEZI|nr:binuclear zinc transcription factor [Colletotrichum tofieldiae]